MRPNFSEFTYGYAITQELAATPRLGITAIPIFPTQVEEGRQGGGYDVMLQLPGLPLFLQFKVSDHMVGPNAREAMEGRFPTPYYRMSIQGSRHSDQHELLIDLENTGQTVYYVSSGFGQIAELNQHYQTRSVCTHSLWLKPNQIGPFADDEAHYVAFRIADGWIVRSEPYQGKGPSDFRSASAELRSRIKLEGDLLTSREYVESLADKLFDIASRKKDIPPIDTDLSRQLLSNRHPLYQIAFLSAVYLDSAFLIARIP